MAYMVNQSEMRSIFNKLTPQNQAKLTVHARQIDKSQRGEKDEKARFNDGNTGLIAGIRNRDNIRPNGNS